MLYIAMPRDVHLAGSHWSASDSRSTAQNRKIICKLECRVRCADAFVQTVKLTSQLFRYCAVSPPSRQPVVKADSNANITSMSPEVSVSQEWTVQPVHLKTDNETVASMETAKLATTNQTATTGTPESPIMLAGMRFPSCFAVPKGSRNETDYFTKPNHHKGNCNNNSSSNKHYSYDSECIAFHPKFCSLLPDSIKLFY